MKTLSRFFLASVLLLGVAQSYAQVGNDNPDGPAGVFNGDISTGGSYDPYTGNATRTITDIVVAGAVGTQPLALSRIYNSRSGSWSCYFGQAGWWGNNYQWGITESAETATSTKPGAYSPASYSVNFPDGRWEVFAYSSFDSDYRAASGIRERFIKLNTTTSLAYLVLPDGSKVEFKGTENFEYDGELHLWYSWYTYTAQALIDRYGLRTTFTYNANGTLQKVTEPAGRYLQFYYATVGSSTVIDHVTASDGRTVQYSYIQQTFPPGTSSIVCLDHVTYYGDATLVAHYKYSGSNTSTNVIPLLWTCDDPMYTGPMRRIAYVYKTTNNADGSAFVYGQLLSEKYYDGTNVGAALTTLAVNSSTTRTETRADGKTRTFTYASGLLNSCTDFKAVSASQTYDSHSYVNSATDRNGHTTNFTLNALTGFLSTSTFASTPGDTPPSTPRGVITYAFGSATCPDSNNRDANNPYYGYSVTDEGAHATVSLRDSAKRVTQINYPDGGSESFTYNSFDEVLTHVLKTGGTETFTYDTRGLKQTYRDPYHASGNPTARYQYDTLDRVSGVTDALGSTSGDVNHTTSFTYNSRGQVLVTTHPVDPIDGQRHTITNTYNPDSTRASVTDELSHLASYTYDDYRRALTITTPGHNTPVTGYSYYDATGIGNDYTQTDGNVTHTISPSGEKSTTTYDENHRKTSVTMADLTADAAKTNYAYDNAGNLVSVISPKEQPGQPYAGQSTVTAYDERNRMMSATDPLGNVTAFMYDASGRKASTTRANGQVTTFESYDAMNRPLQQTVKQTPDPDAVTKYTYYSSGLLHTMQDPRLVANSSSYNYSYNYDQMGRKTSVTYPPDASSAQRTESWHYDTAGRNDTFTNRAGNVQTITYDALCRPTNIAWNDGGVTPTVTVGYDIASRPTSIVNANATVARAYFNDNLLSSETATYADSTARAVTYAYNADSDRATIQYPNGAYSFTYSYTNRDQLLTLVNNSGGGTVVTYGYDPDGNLATRTPDNGTASAYTYDALDRVTHISHALNGDTRTFDYDYDSVSNRKWTKRDGGTGDVFGYDLNDQVTAVKLDISNPDTTSVGAQTIVYDANGNRSSFAAYGPTDTYATNNLNQYGSRNSNPATYNVNADMTAGVDGSTYTYDAQNRLLTATKGVTETFIYDGLNRQISRTIDAGSPTYNVYDGWTLIAEYASGATTPTTAYLSGAGGLVKNLTTNGYYYQDASRSTSHLANSTGNLLEWYRYDLHGTPVFYDALNNQLSASNYSVRHLFTGQQWYQELGLYDLRNRFYSPDIGRFLQADPIGFSGDASNLYRYCGNNPLTQSDPSGTMPSAWAGRGLATSFFAEPEGWGAVLLGVGIVGGFIAVEVIILHESEISNTSWGSGTFGGAAVYGGASRTQTISAPSDDGPVDQKQTVPDDEPAEYENPEINLNLQPLPDVIDMDFIESSSGSIVFPDNVHLLSERPVPEPGAPVVYAPGSWGGGNFATDFPGSLIANLINSGPSQMSWDNAPTQGFTNYNAAFDPQPAPANMSKLY